MGKAASKQSKHKAAEDVAQRGTSRIDAAALLAARNLGETPEWRQKPLSNEEIAQHSGVSRTTLYRWMHRDSEFNALVGDAEGQIKADALRVPSANVHHRIKNMDRICQGILRAIHLRSTRYQAMIADSPQAAMRQVFGDITPEEAATGLYVENKKIAANGQTVTDFALDSAAIRELRETYKHIAQQLKQWDETVNLNHGGSVDHRYHNEGLGAITDDTKLAQIEAWMAGEDE